MIRDTFYKENTRVTLEQIDKRLQSEGWSSSPEISEYEVNGSKYSKIVYYKDDFDYQISVHYYTDNQKPSMISIDNDDWKNQ